MLAAHGVRQLSMRFRAGTHGRTTDSTASGHARPSDLAREDAASRAAYEAATKAGITMCGWRWCR